MIPFLTSRACVCICTCLYIIVTLWTIYIKMVGGTFGNTDNFIVYCGWIYGTIIGMSKAQKIEDRYAAQLTALLWTGTFTIISNCISDVIGIILDQTLPMELAVGTGIGCLYPLLLLPMGLVIIKRFSRNPCPKEDSR